MEYKESVDNKNNREKNKKVNRRNIGKGYIILYLGTFIFIIIGEVVLSMIQDDFSLLGLIQDIIGNLMGVLAAFLVFDIAHEKLSKDAYASEVSEQILDTLMYHPEAMELYENRQKKVFVNAFIRSIVDDSDASDMINHYLSNYLLTQKDFIEDKRITDKDCRIRTAFSYRFVLEIERTQAFKDLAEIIEGKEDPYFYVQEELNYKVKYLADKGNNTKNKEVKIGFIYDNAELDRFLRGQNGGKDEELLKSCLFRECLDLEEIDKKLFYERSKDKKELINIIKRMFRPHLNIDRYKGELTDVEIIPDSCIIITFTVDHDVNKTEHMIDIIFHMPKKWNTLIEVALVEPTKEPKISLSYNEDFMDVEMYSFLNKGEASSYENSSENENGIYSIALSNEWVFPISGVVFPVKKKESAQSKNHEC